MASMDTLESMEEDFTGFEEEPIGVVVNPSGAAVLDGETTRMEEAVNETDSDSGNLVIAEPEKKQTPKSVERSPRKRKSKVEDITPTRAPSSRVRGQGLAYLIAMEKGGSKKQLAKAQAQVDAKDASNLASLTESSPVISDQQDVGDPKPAPVSDLESDKKKAAGRQKDSSKISSDPSPVIAKEKETSEIEARKDPPLDQFPTPGSIPSESPVLPIARPTKSGSRKSFAAVNISSPLLKEPFKEGWRREVVYRATVDPGNKTLCDVYYYAPDGKKLRSGREIADYLDKIGSSLSNENFTFFKEPIGMDSTQEILRYAKTNRRDDGTGGEKLITKKEKALKAREDELRRNLQELGEDVAAITGQDGEAATGSVPVGAGVSDINASPQIKKKKGGKVEKQLKIKLWGKGLKSKENAEPMRKEDTTEGEEDGEPTMSTIGGKASPPHAVPDDISHLFTPHVGGTKSKPLPRGQKGAGTGTDSSGAAQHLVLINGKRFVSVGPNAEAARHPSGNNSQEELSSKRQLGSPSSNSLRSPKRTKLSLGSPSQHSSRIKQGAFALFSADQFNNFVSYAYHGLLHVFRYLTVQELMAAAGVCKLWRDLALHHSHWRVVRLKNSRIYDWTLFASHLRRAGTQHLDMRKMLFVTSAEETWSNLERAASNLSAIRRIDLCKCPAEVLHSIASHCHRLKCIDAQFISSSSISLDSLSNLTQLEELKIRSVSGMSLGDGLQAISHLKQLKSLSLTTLSNLKSSELTQLSELPHLESLEIGDCTLWTEECDYAVLNNLAQLRHLRLEQGPSGDSILQFLENALCKMSCLQHAELINFSIDAPMEALKASGLKRFLVIPRYKMETLRATMQNLSDCVTSMQHLQQFCWVVTNEILDACADGKLPLGLGQEDEQGSASLDEIEELLRQRLPQTNVRLLRLPEYATHRYSLVDRED